LYKLIDTFVSVLGEIGECSWIEGKFGLGLNSNIDFRLNSRRPI